jgi:hypothetical protein
VVGEHLFTDINRRSEHMNSEEWATENALSPVAPDGARIGNELWPDLARRPPVILN